MSRQLLTAVVFGVLASVPLRGQCADTLVRAVTAHTDSLRDETLRRSPTTGNYLAPRATVVRRHAARIQTLVNACGVPEPVPPPPIGTTTTTLWDSGHVGAWRAGTDSAIICAAVQVGPDSAITAQHVGASYVIAHVKPAPDSIRWRVVIPSTLGGLREACRPTWNNTKYGHIASRQPFPVQWVPRVVENAPGVPFTIAFPFAIPVVP